MASRVLWSLLWLACWIVNIVSMLANLAFAISELLTDEADAILYKCRNKLDSRESDRFGKP